MICWVICGCSSAGRRPLPHVEMNGLMRVMMSPAPLPGCQVVKELTPLAKDKSRGHFSPSEQEREKGLVCLEGRSLGLEKVHILPCATKSRNGFSSRSHFPFDLEADLH